jgi:hypothetical protein
VPLSWPGAIAPAPHSDSTAEAAIVTVGVIVGLGIILTGLSLCVIARYNA